MGSACSDNVETHTAASSRRNTSGHVQFESEESVTTPKYAPAESDGFGFSLFSASYEVVDSPLEYDIWKKLAIYSANVPTKLKKKVWKTVETTEDGKPLTERKTIAKLLKLYLMLYLTREYKKKGREVPDKIKEYLPLASQAPAKYIEEFIKQDPEEIGFVFARVHDALYARTQTTSISPKKQRKFAKKAQLVQLHYEELTEAELSSEFNKEDFLISAYLQYLMYAYHLTIPEPEPTPEPSPEPLAMTPGFTPSMSTLDGLEAYPEPPVDGMDPTDLDANAENVAVDGDDAAAGITPAVEAEEVPVTKPRSGSIFDVFFKKEEEEIKDDAIDPMEEPEESEPEEVEEEVVGDGIDRTLWTPESIEWEQKLELVAKLVIRAGPNFREKIWTKFDRRGHGYMDMHKELSRLLYALFAFYVKTQMRGRQPPKFSALLPLLHSMCPEVQDLVNEVDEDYENEFMMKDDFVNNMDVYMKKIARKRLNIEDTPPPKEPTPEPVEELEDDQKERVDSDEEQDGNASSSDEEKGPTPETSREMSRSRDVSREYSKSKEISKSQGTEKKFGLF